MTAKQVTESLHAKGLLSEEEARRLTQEEKTRPFSLFYELRLLLYLGIALLCAGLGTLVYQHLDSLGHQAIIGFISLAMLGTFAYTYVHRKAFSWDEVHASKLEDFSLLASALLFLILEGYIQYQYHLFGERYDFVTFLPALVFFPCAYFFDHRGVLSMAITALASWLGIKIAPVSLWWTANFSSFSLTNTAILFGIGLIAIGILSEVYQRKRHFTFTYLLFGVNLAIVAALVGLFQYSYHVVYAVIIAILVLFAVGYARRTQAYQFLLMAVIYGYIAFTYCLSFISLPTGLEIWLIVLYFIFSGIAVIAFLLNIKRILKN